MPIQVVVYSLKTQGFYYKKKDGNISFEETPEIDNAELLKALTQTKNNKRPGEDCISPEMWKIVWEQLEDKVKILLNKCLIHRTIPEAWEKAEVILLYKQGDRNNIQNYPPIMLQAGFHRIFSIIDRLQYTRLSK